MKVILQFNLIIFILVGFWIEGFSQRDTSKQAADSINGVYIPVDLNDCFEQLNILLHDTTIAKIRAMNEEEFLVTTHFGLGMWIRNNWGLWSGSRLSVYFNNMGIYHPDDMSYIILRSYYRYLTNKSIHLKRQLKQIKKYWRKSTRRQKKIEKENLKETKQIFKSINIGDTLEFSYDYDFISQEQENKWMDDLCIAKGIVLDKNKRELLLKIKLIESCDENGIIIFKGDIYRNEGNKWILIEKNKIETMRQGEIKWLTPDLWYPIDD